MFTILNEMRRRRENIIGSLERSFVKMATSKNDLLDHPHPQTFRSFPPVENVFKFSSKCLLFSMNNYGCEKPKSVYILQLMMGQAIIYQQRCALQNRFTLGNLINVLTLQLPSNFKVENKYFIPLLVKLTVRKLSSLPIRKDELERSPSLRV